MRTNPLSLAALATTAVDGLDVVGAAEDGSDEHRLVIAATLRDGDVVQVVLPRSVSALETAEANERSLAALTIATRARLPFDVPSMLGSSDAGNSRVFVLTRLGGSPMALADLAPDNEGLAASVGRALAAIHELPTSVVADAGLPHRSAAQVRQGLLDTLDQAAGTSLVPPALLERWESALGDDGLWQFKPAVIHGDVQSPAFRIDDHDSETLVVGLDGWHALSVGDPSRDLAFLLGSAEFESVDEAFAAHAAGRGIGDRHVRQRAMLHAELDVARWLIFGVQKDDQSIVSDARAMLAGLTARVDDDPSAAIEPEKFETMDLDGVQAYLDETDPRQGS